MGGEILISIIVKFAGFIGSTQESGEVHVNLPASGTASLEEIAKNLNAKIGFKILEKRTLSKGKVRVLHEGMPLTDKEWKDRRVKAGDQVSVVVPIMGG